MTRSVTRSLFLVPGLLVACGHAPPPPPPPPPAATVAPAPPPAPPPPPAVIAFTDATPLGALPTKKEAGAESCRVVSIGELPEQLKEDPHARDSRVTFAMARTKDGAMLAWAQREGQEVSVLSLDRTLHARGTKQVIPIPGKPVSAIDVVGTGDGVMLLVVTGKDFVAQALNETDAKPVGPIATSPSADLSLNFAPWRGGVEGRRSYSPDAIFFYATPADAPAEKFPGGSPIVFTPKVDASGAHIERTVLDFKWKKGHVKLPSAFSAENGHWAAMMAETERTARVFTNVDKPFTIPLKNTLALAVDILLDHDEVTATAATNWDKGCNQIVAGLDGKVHSKKEECPAELPRRPDDHVYAEAFAKLVRKTNGVEVGTQTPFSSKGADALAWLGDRYGVVFSQAAGDNAWSLQTAFIDCKP